MKVTSRVNYGKLKQINMAAIQSLKMTGEAVRDNLVKSQTMPFGDGIKKTEYGKRGKYRKDGTQYKGKVKVVREGGYLQNIATTTDNSKASSGKVSIISDTPYARRLYYHPEYNFNKKNNPNAGGLWFEPYINGNKKDYAKKVFTRYLRNRIWD